MKDNKNEKAVVYITRSGIQFFGTSSQAVASMAYDAQVVRDLDVSVIGPLSNQIQAFIDQNKLVPSPVIFVFSESACFYSDTKETDETKLKVILTEFVNTVPFETLITKVYRGKDNARIVSVNEKLYREIASSFETKGFLSVGVVPAFVLGAKTGMAPALDISTAKQILANIENIRSQSFLATEEKRENGEVAPEKTSNGGGIKVSRNMLLLGAVLVILVIVFVIVLMSQS